MHVVATAGHVDHGKSALVRALTGMEPDRWAEERRRGLTLDLGFAWTRLDAGGTEDDLAFVDVPGHERLVVNMLAGVGPAPAVLFVVAADQGWQAQSEEHLAVLHALGVRHGLLAVTRCDLADPEPVRTDALERLAATSLGRTESVAVSAVTGEGLDALRQALGRLAARLPEPDLGAPVRLWADRSFTVRGRGTVVTGTLPAGRLAAGDRLEVAGRDFAVRVRGLQVMKEDRTEAGAVARVAVNVHGSGADTVRRGDALVTPGRWTTTRIADVRLTGAVSDELPRHLTLHVGSLAVPVTVRPVGPDTARLSWNRLLPMHIGDRALLRDPGRHRIPAGVTVLDVRPPGFARRGAAAARARELNGLSGVPDAASELRRRGLLRRGELMAMGVTSPQEPVAGEWLADPLHWDGLGKSLVEAVEAHARDHPLEPGLPVEAARRLLGLPDRDLVEALTAASGGRLQHREGRLYGSVDRPALPEEVRAAVAAVRQDLARAPFRAPESDRLTQLGLTPAVLAAVAAAGELLRVGSGIVLLPDSDERAAGLLADLEQPFTLAQARKALGTTRRVAVPLLEYMDERGWTERVDGTLRRLAPAGPPVGSGDRREPDRSLRRERPPARRE